MRARTYSLAEVDLLRAAAEYEFVWGRGPVPIGGASRSYDAKEAIVATEERVRTYMAAGLDPESLADEVFGKGLRVYSAPPPRTLERGE